jgi:hypothetical protein
MSQGKKSVARRTFLAGVFTGAGILTAFSVAAPKKAVARKVADQSGTARDPILYRRTKETERYYRTLYT